MAMGDYNVSMLSAVFSIDNMNGRVCGAPAKYSFAVLNIDINEINENSLRKS